MIKETDLAGALQRIADGSGQVCMLMPIGMKTTVEELIKAKSYAVITQQSAENKENPKPEKKKVDHGRIMALYKAGWTIKNIADDVGCSVQTVYTHISQGENNEKHNNGSE